MQTTDGSEPHVAVSGIDLLLVRGSSAQLRDPRSCGQISGLLPDYMMTFWAYVALVKLNPDLEYLTPDVGGSAECIPGRRHCVGAYGPPESSQWLGRAGMAVAAVA